MSIDYIPIPLNSNLLDRLRYNYSHLGPSFFILVAEMLVKQHDHKLTMSTTNIGIIAEKLRLEESKVIEILTDLTNEAEIFDKELFEHDILFCPELERNINECCK
jgi:hypothetical protein